MARVFALDWDQHEARYLLGSIAGKNVQVHEAGVVPLVDVAEGGNEPKPDLGGSLGAALSGRKLGHVRTLVGVPRSSIELLHFTVPPAKDPELPQMVANQAMRESQLIGEESILDFVPREGDPAGPREVTAAALSPEERSRIEKACGAAGLKVDRLLLRPFASTSLFLRKGSPPETSYLLVNCMTDEVDLTWVVDGEPVFLRTARLPERAGASEVIERLLMEINRTLVAAPQGALGGDSVECVYVFGRSSEQEELVDRIREDLSLSARTFDPFEALGVGQEQVPENPGHFASLLGMLLDEATGSHLIDFSHPRKALEPISRGRIALFAGAVLAAVVLLVGWNTWSDLAAVHDKNESLKARKDQLNKTLKTAAAQKKRIEAIAQWKSRDISWLDEFRDLSIRFPSSRDVVVLRMSMGPSQSGGGVINFQGLVRDPRIVHDLERQIRGPHRNIRNKTIQERTADRDYTWHFDGSISVARQSADRYVSHLPPESRPADETALAEASPAEPPGKGLPRQEVSRPTRAASAKEVSP